MTRCRRPLVRVAVAVITLITAAVGAATAAAEPTDASVVLPGPPTNLRVVATFTGTDVSWGEPSPRTEQILSFVVYRHAGGVTTTYTLPYSYFNGQRWRDPQRPADATYAVSAVTADGEGPPTQAASPVPTRDVITGATTVVDESGRYNSALAQVNVEAGTQAVPVATTGPASDGVHDVASSPDGRLVAFTRFEFAGNDDTALWSMRTDAPGDVTPVRLGPVGLISHPAWSPDGSRIAFERKVGTDTCLEVVPATGGSVVRIGCKLRSPSWLPDGQLVAVVTQNDYAVRIPARADALSSPYGFNTSSRVYKAAASPDGRWVAVAANDFTKTYLDGMRVELLPVVPGAARVGPDLRRPISDLTWSPDGRSLVARADGQLRRFPVNADGTFGAETSVAAVGTPAWQGPGIVVKASPASTGSTASIPFDTSAMATGTTVTCQLDTTPATACTSPYIASGLRSGVRTVRITAVEPGGRTVVGTRLFTAPAGVNTAISLTAPTDAVTKFYTVRITALAAADAGIRRYEMRTRRAAYNGAFGPYEEIRSSPDPGYSYPMVSGYEYCFSARGQYWTATAIWTGPGTGWDSDMWSNWSAERCTARPVDDRSMTLATPGWVRTTWSKFYLNSATQTNRYGASLTRTVSGKRFYLVATRCPTCGLVSVYLGGRYITAVNLHSATTQRQAVIPLPVQPSAISGTLKLTTRSTGKLVQIDGLAVRRT